MLIAQMLRRLHNLSSFENAAHTVLDDAIALHGAELGNVQLKAGDDLVIVAQRGFKRPFLEFFRRVTTKDECACGRALRTGDTAIVPDIETDGRDALRAAKVKSVMTTPLLSSRGVIVGAVSAHFVRSHTPTLIEVQTLKSYSMAAADYLLELLGDETLGGQSIIDEPLLV
jgi:GAF domain-containing protein